VLIIFSTIVFDRLSKGMRGWLTSWPPWLFTNPMRYSETLCLHWSVILPLCFHLF